MHAKQNTCSQQESLPRSLGTSKHTPQVGSVTALSVGAAGEAEPLAPAPLPPFPRLAPTAPETDFVGDVRDLVTRPRPPAVLSVALPRLMATAFNPQVNAGTPGRLGQSTQATPVAIEQNQVNISNEGTYATKFDMYDSVTQAQRRGGAPTQFGQRK